MAASPRQAALFYNRERRRDAAKVQHATLQFDLGTVGAGGDLPESYTLAAAGDFAISFDAPVAAGEVTVATEVGRTLGTPALAADQIHRLGYFERARTLTVTSAIAGTATLYVLDNWRRPIVVATGVFT